MHSEVAPIFCGIEGRRRITLLRARTGDPQLSIIRISRIERRLPARAGDAGRKRGEAKRACHR
jgi:hypothetical protein